MMMMMTIFNIIYLSSKLSHIIASHLNKLINRLGLPATGSSYISGSLSPVLNTYPPPHHGDERDNNCRSVAKKKIDYWFFFSRNICRNLPKKKLQKDLIKLKQQRTRVDKNVEQIRA